jgi:hypothetical protein
MIAGFAAVWDIEMRFRPNTRTPIPRRPHASCWKDGRNPHRKHQRANAVRRQSTPTEYSAGLKFAINGGWLELHDGTFVKCARILFARVAALGSSPIRGKPSGRLASQIDRYDAFIREQGPAPANYLERGHITVCTRAPVADAVDP